MLQLCICLSLHSLLRSLNTNLKEKNKSILFQMTQSECTSTQKPQELFTAKEDNAFHQDLPGFELGCIKGKQVAQEMFCNNVSAGTH